VTACRVRPVPIEPSRIDAVAARSGTNRTCSQPLSNTRLLGGLSISSNDFYTWAAWFLDSVKPMTLTSHFSMARRMVRPSRSRCRAVSFRVAHR
jgi:hypothetical protein